MASRSLARFFSCILLWAALTIILLNTIFLSFFHHHTIDQLHSLITSRFNDPVALSDSAKSYKALFRTTHYNDSGTHHHRPPPTPRYDWIVSRYKVDLEVPVVTTITRQAVQAVQPLKTREEQLRSARCFRSERGYEQVGYALLVQMRDGHGRTIQRYLNAMARDHPGQIMYLSESHTFNTSCFHHQGELVSITHLRHPILRIVSGYWNQVRIDQGKKDKSSRADRVVGKEENSERRSIEEWIDTTLASHSKRRKAYHARFVGVSVDNYYIKILTNRYRNPMATVTRRDLALAKKILASFDVVMIAEWMAHDNQTDYINALLGEERAGRRLLRLRVTVGEEMEDNCLISHDVIKRLEEMNRLDLELFAFAKDLVAVRMESFYANKSAYVLPYQASDGECRTPINHPRWHSSGNYSLVTPTKGSHLFTPPFCIKG